MLEPPFKVGKAGSLYPAYSLASSLIPQIFGRWIWAFVKQKNTPHPFGQHNTGFGRSVLYNEN